MEKRTPQQNFLIPISDEIVDIAAAHMEEINRVVAPFSDADVSAILMLKEYNESMYQYGLDIPRYNFGRISPSPSVLI